MFLFVLRYVIILYISLCTRLRRDRERQEQLARERLARRKRRGKPEEEEDDDEPDPDKGYIFYYFEKQGPEQQLVQYEILS